MKRILLAAALMFAFASCQKEDPIEPAPQPTVPTGPTVVYKSFVSNPQAMVIIQGSTTSFSGTIQDCGFGVQLDKFAFNVDEVYQISFQVGTTYEYVGDIKFNSNMELVEVTGNTAPGTATIGLQQCNSVQGVQLVVYP
jgi:hypothetical protein